MSILLRPDLSPARVPILTLGASVATADAVSRMGLETGVKWPNDVLAVDAEGTERKLAGILTEMEGETDDVSWVIVGIGLNANVSVDRLPAGATSLQEQFGDVDRGRLVADVLDRFDTLRANPDDILPAWRGRSLTLGRRVRMETADGPIVGDAVEVGPPGRLRIDVGDGSGTETGDANGDVWVHAGDCEHLYPAADGPRDN